MLSVRDFLKFYTNDPFIGVLADILKNKEASRLQLKGLKGSLDAVVASSIYKINKQTTLFILHDKEEAAYFFNDLQYLLGIKEVLFFPTSYKRPYEFEEVENANILMRAEILNRINHKASTGELIVTYPEALTEKVINKRSLRKNTLTIKKGDETETSFLAEMLVSYGFERSDFVYEAGQFSVRGGIVDIYSYAHDLPYRLEFFGDEIESIRTFDPNSQLSKEDINEINIIPNVQTKLLEEQRQSFLQFLPPSTKVWIKDYELTENIIEKYFQKASGSFKSIKKSTNESTVVLHPQDLFETAESFAKSLLNFSIAEFGNRYFLPNAETLELHSSAQPSFNKNFQMIADDLDQQQQKGYTNILISDSEKQLEKLHSIFEEIDPYLELRSLKAALRQGFVDHERRLLCYTDHQLFERFHRYKLKEKHVKSKSLTLRELKNLQPGDYVTHIDHGIGRFAGMEKVKVNEKNQEAIRLIYRDDDILYVSIHSLHKISKYSGKEGGPPSMSKLGSQEWENKKKKTKKKVKDIAKDLIQLYAKRKSAPGFAFQQDTYLQTELETSFIYEDTPDQAKSTAEVKVDMEQAHPMDRLICGDVGFGKTEVAIRAAFKAVNDSKQVAVLVPTTILAMQHYRTFKDRLTDFPVKVDYINRFKSTTNVRQTTKDLKEGKLDIVIGTHRLVNKDIEFKNLGLLIIDEEQKFGVKVKEKLKEFRVNVDVLTLTATPIPRTLHFSLMGARDLSVISTPPPNRQPVTTEIHTFNETVVRDAISFELRRGGQVFFVHNRINDIEQVGNIILKLVPDARIGVAHGQMEGSRLEKVMVKFIEGEYDVLVSTNIIESGLDIPNANTIIINQAHMFGLSDLHQMRGRVGRSNKKAFCYLLTMPQSVLTAEARKRLTTLEEFSDLGDGFKVAMRDLDIRGAGNMLGAEQSGFINDLGFDAYHKILDEAIQELKETEFRDLFKNELELKPELMVKDCNIETDFEIIIPENYVESISERLRLYNELDNINDEEELVKFQKNLKDRFGQIPDQVYDLFKIVRIRWNAEVIGIEKLILKNGALKAYLPTSDNERFYQSDNFGNLIAFMQKTPRISRIKEMKNRMILIIDDVDSLEKATKLLEGILNHD